jgi:predicted TIM-barrel fold metal-dependent hydrolase
MAPGDGALTSNKIDTHHHFLPKPYVEAGLASRIPNFKVPDWSPERAIEIMDHNGIAEAILSVPFAPQGGDAPAVIRQCNEMGASLRARFPGRFGHFATLPLPDIDASLAELAYCRDALNVDGFLILCRYGDDYLGDAVFDPLFAELDRNAAIVFTHPQVSGVSPVVPPAILEFPFDTTRMATNLILKAVHRRFPRIRFILSHAGGTVPYLYPRIALAADMIPGAAERVGDVAAALRGFYYDTALSAGVATMTALSMITDPDHILFGSDWPMAPDQAVEKTSKGIEALCASGVLPHTVLRDNAAKLLGRVQSSS